MRVRDQVAGPRIRSRVGPRNTKSLRSVGFRACRALGFRGFGFRCRGFRVRVIVGLVGPRASNYNATYPRPTLHGSVTRPCKQTCSCAICMQVILDSRLIVI